MVDPKSMTIDIKALMGAFNEDTNAIGVVKVEVRGATRDSSIKLQGAFVFLKKRKGKKKKINRFYMQIWKILMLRYH